MEQKINISSVVEAGGRKIGVTIESHYHRASTEKIIGSHGMQDFNLPEGWQLHVSAVSEKEAVFEEIAERLGLAKIKTTRKGVIFLIEKEMHQPNSFMELIPMAQKWLYSHQEIKNLVEKNQANQHDTVKSSQN